VTGTRSGSAFRPDVLRSVGADDDLPLLRIDARLFSGVGEFSPDGIMAGESHVNRLVRRIGNDARRIHAHESGKIRLDMNRLLLNPGDRSDKGGAVFQRDDIRKNGSGRKKSQQTKQNHQNGYFFHENLLADFRDPRRQGVFMPS